MSEDNVINIEGFKKKDMITFRTIKHCKDSVTKLLNSDDIEDIDIVIELAGCKMAFETVLEQFNRGYNSIITKYMKLAEKRAASTKDIMDQLKEMKDGSMSSIVSTLINGWNSADEVESKEVEIELFLNKPVTINLDFPELNKKTIKDLYSLRRKSEDKKKIDENTKPATIYTSADIASFIEIGLFKN